MRSGTESALARVVKVFGAARPHHAYLFANRRANRMKVLVHDGIGVWLAARRLNSGRFVWPREALSAGAAVELSRAQLDALVLGLPWQRIGEAGVITLL
ncbi:MAG: IS66 family insertion sequence element accessory protein TnpB [Acidovorax sp.]|nr:IS66 family insertion sequence element accessory protein TnpB [Acidovorax sp.]MCO4095338.1 IS66 family insertion sequence element accessory protein TnpB [Acidovorax sp.]